MDSNGNNLSLNLPVDSKEPYALLDKVNNTLTFFYGEKQCEREDSDTEIMDIELGLAGKESEKECRKWQKYADLIETVIFDDSFANYHGLRSTRRWFACLHSLTAIKGLHNLCTEKVTDMSEMFYSCRQMCQLDLSPLNTSNAQNMTGFLCWCTSLESLNLTGIDTRNVTSMSRFFYSCLSLRELDLSGLDTSKVQFMNEMFALCHSLKKLDVRNWDTHSVTSMASMFEDDFSLEGLDLSNFDTENVVNMTNMFQNCHALRKLDVSGFRLKKVFASLTGLKTDYA